MIDFNDKVVLWLIVWAIVGSTLGFFTIRNTPVWTDIQRLQQYLLSVSVGVFFAFPTYYFLNHYNTFNTDLSIMISGGVSFAITDIIINYWPKIIKTIGDILGKVIDKLIGKI